MIDPERSNQQEKKNTCLGEANESEQVERGNPKVVTQGTVDGSKVLTNCEVLLQTASRAKSWDVTIRFLSLDISHRNHIP